MRVCIYMCMYVIKSDHWSKNWSTTSHEAHEQRLGIGQRDFSFNPLSAFYRVTLCHVMYFEKT